jgi:hypothetical protein
MHCPFNKAILKNDWEAALRIALDETARLSQMPIRDGSGAFQTAKEMVSDLTAQIERLLAHAKLKRGHLGMDEIACLIVVGRELGHATACLEAASMSPTTTGLEGMQRKLH